MRRELPETEGLLIFRARADGAARYNGQLTGTMEQGIAAPDPRWLRWVQSLPDYGFGVGEGEQSADGVMPFTMEFDGLGDAPLD